MRESSSAMVDSLILELVAEMAIHNKEKAKIRFEIQGLVMIDCLISRHKVKVGLLILSVVNIARITQVDTRSGLALVLGVKSQATSLMHVIMFKKGSRRSSPKLNYSKRSRPTKGLTRCCSS